MRNLPSAKWNLSAVSQSFAHPTRHEFGDRRFDMVALDVDGTLLRDSKTLSGACANAVRAVVDLGIKVVLASARPPRSLGDLHRALKLNTPTINYNGALIHDPISDQSLRHRPLDAEVARAVVNHARQIDPEIVVSLEVLDRWLTDRVDPSLLTETAKTFEPDVIAPLETLFATPITKLMLLADAGRLARVREAIELRFINQVGLTVSDDHLLQLLAPGIDKGESLAWLAARDGITPGRVLAIGDAPNDAAMLQWAGLGIAVSSGWPEAIAAADVTVPGNDKDGVAVALQQYILDIVAQPRTKKPQGNCGPAAG